jgi:N-acetylglucosaminyl-diphospho-decaprenol L-rhamnosyltransferase
VDLHPRVSISIVSHGQAALVDALLRDLAEHVATPIELLLTVNIPEAATPDLSRLPFPARAVHNAKPRGFGANHNAAFRESHGEFFCVVNPDIRLESDPFPALLSCLLRPDAGLTAPRIHSPRGAVEDNARRFPTVWTILRKALGGALEIDYPVTGTDPVVADWVAGMFMLFPRNVFEEIGGFDERYFLYYEDVDLCARLGARGRRVLLCQAATVIHDARRQSRRSLRYLRWHFASMIRFFLTRYARARPEQRVK